MYITYKYIWIAGDQQHFWKCCYSNFLNRKEDWWGSRDTDFSNISTVEFHLKLQSSNLIISWSCERIYSIWPSKCRVCLWLFSLVINVLTEASGLGNLFPGVGTTNLNCQVCWNKWQSRVSKFHWPSECRSTFFTLFINTKTLASWFFSITKKFI